MDTGAIVGLFAVLLATVITQGTIIWRKLGKIEVAVNNACPFGQCPFYKRAIHEAAPEREIELREE